MGAIDRLRESDAWRDVIEGETGRRVRELTRRTPVVEGPSGVLVKAEGLQRTGSFKARGAVAKLATLGPDRGVVTASAGNHGLGVAYAARALGLRATVVVSEMAPDVKRRGIEALGARLLVHGSGYDEAEARARDLPGDAVFVSGFDDEHVMLGNGGTTALELSEQLGGLGPRDLVLIPVGGGGLASGIGAVLAGSGARLVGVEPESNRAMHVSFAEGEARTSYPEGGPTLAEGLEGAVAERPFELCREALQEIVLVSEDGIRSAIARGFVELGLILEASAAVSLAAVWDGAAAADGGRVVCIATGSNIDPDLLDDCLRG
ncbi:MAG TPA: pyridoxal-phosphate dependent enzyme [Actinomycetota bacterium]|nr:pyridoxal-phosphate dependent enzyme [Actinomycetota bacterium]